MKAHKIVVTIKTTDGDKKVSALAFKHWAFHKADPYADYTITHIASGMCLPFHHLPLQKKARILAKMLEGMEATWDGEGTPNNNFEFEALSIKRRFVEDIA